MNPRVIPLVAGAFACSFPLLSVAQTADVPALSPIVVTASRIEQDARDVLGDVTVIDRGTLERAGQTSLAETLSRSPGVEYVNRGGPQNTTNVYIRGAEPDHTLVLIDGIRVNSSIVGTTFLEAFQPDMFDRVEILRGAASSLYGADAIGGVINLITHQPTDADKPFSASGSVGYGTYGSTRTRLGVSGAQNGFDYTLAGSYAQSRGFNATKETSSNYNPDRDGYYQNNLLGSLGYRWAPGHRIGLTAYRAYLNGQYDQGPDFFTGEYFNDRARTKQEVYAISSTDDITRYWQSVLRYAYSEDEQKNYTSFGKTALGSKKHQYTWQNNFTLSEIQSFSLVLERLEERAAGTTTYDVDSRQTNSVGGVYRLDLGRHHLQLNARNDNSDVYGNETTGGANYAFDLTSKLRAGIGANTGFKTPTIQDLYFPGFSNPDLKPERSRNIEASLRYTDEHTRLGVVAYRNKVKNLIVTNPWPMLPALDNIDRATLEGLTFTAEQDFGATTVRGSVDLQRPKNEETGDQLPYRARQVYRLGADHRFGAFRVGGELYVSGKRYDPVGTRARLGGYTLVNATASYDINRNMQAQLRWNNLFNRDYTLVRGYETPGSNVFVNLSWRM